MSQTAIIVALLIAGILAGTFLSLSVERRRERRKWRRYAHSGREPASIVCPACRRRSYSQQAIAKGYCHDCRQYHDQLRAA